MRFGFFFIIIVVIVAGCTEIDVRDTDETPLVAEKTLEVSSPDNENTIHFMLVDGNPMYSILRSSQVIITPSKMGFTFKKENSSLGPLDLINANTSGTDETWEQIWGEKQKIRNHYNQLSVSLQEKSNTRRIINIEFRVYDDGVAFR